MPSSANAPPAKEIPSTPPAGKNAFTLIGVSEFNLPAHRDQTVVIKGLFIKATPDEPGQHDLRHHGVSVVVPPPPNELNFVA